MARHHLLMVTFQSVKIDLPGWISNIDDLAEPRPHVEDRMELVLDLVERNIADGGGPFAAGIFDADGVLIAPGLNRVVACSAPIAHAEVVAIALAGQVLGTWDLSSKGDLELVSSTEPCAMCLGAIPWSGVRALTTGARDEDARAIGFDEGDKISDWSGSLERRGIAVKRDVGRGRAASLLRQYQAAEGEIYNG